MLPQVGRPVGTDMGPERALRRIARTPPLARSSLFRGGSIQREDDRQFRGPIRRNRIRGSRDSAAGRHAQTARQFRDLNLDSLSRGCAIRRQTRRGGASRLASDFQLKLRNAKAATANITTSSVRAVRKTTCGTAPDCGTLCRQSRRSIQTVS